MGPYCYTCVGYNEITEKPIYKNCPYWIYRNDEVIEDEPVFCDYMQKTDVILLNDGCKICDINNNWEDFGQWGDKK